MSDEVKPEVVAVPEAVKPEEHPLVVAGGKVLSDRVSLLDALKKQWSDLEVKIKELEKLILG